MRLCCYGHVAIVCRGCKSSETVGGAGEGKNLGHTCPLRLRARENINRIVHEDNAKMHWEYMDSWCMNRVQDNLSRRVLRGYSSARSRDFFTATNSGSIVGFRPAFVPLTPDDTGNGQVVPVATLYMDGKPVLVPRYPVMDGDVQEYRNGTKLEFREPLDDPRYQIQVIKVDGIYIADRNLLCDISWDELNRQGFGYQAPAPKAELPTLEAAAAAPNWEKMFSWLDEPVRCGYLAPDFTMETDPAIENEKIGFRPMFAGDPNIPNGVGVPIATLYLSGSPTRIPKYPDHEGDIPEFKSGDKIEFREPLGDPEYQITATAVGDKLIADYCVLRNISWNELKAQGF